ncbi:MAG: hypothetical protein AAFO96_24975, partial [Bacteroidota bacterium]
MDNKFKLFSKIIQKSQFYSSNEKFINLDVKKECHRQLCRPLSPIPQIGQPEIPLKKYREFH